MQHETNAEFVSAIERELEGVEFFSVGPCPGCAECGLEHVTDMDEAGDREIEAASLDNEFSINDCDSCRSSLAGARHPAHGYVTFSDGQREFVHMSVCVDCAMYHANGELPFDDDTADGETYELS